METPIKMDDLGGSPLFLETPIWKKNTSEKCIRLFARANLVESTIFSTHDDLSTAYE